MSSEATSGNVCARTSRSMIWLYDWQKETPQASPDFSQVVTKPCSSFCCTWENIKSGRVLCIHAPSGQAMYYHSTAVPSASAHLNFERVDNVGGYRRRNPKLERSRQGLSFSRTTCRWSLAPILYVYST